MKVGFIGCGNLGSSLIKGFLRANSLKADEVIASDLDEGKLKGLKELGVEVTGDNKRVAKLSNVIFIAVKPDIVGKILDEMREFSRGKLLISVAAGVSTKSIEERTDARVIRVMPNICSLVAEMASCFSLGSKASAKDRELVKGLLGSVGTTFEVEEEMMDAVTGLSGSGPAYFYLIIKALTEAGVKEGLQKNVAERLAAQTAKGAGAMVLKSGKTPDELIEAVRSPGGTTAEGLKVMEAKRVPEAMAEAVKAATKKARELAK